MEGTEDTWLANQEIARELETTEKLSAKERCTWHLTK